jgi:broad specificity phosphatase PhoE
MSSAWCRCRDTAELMTGRPPEVLSALNSFFNSDAETGNRQVADLREWIAGQSADQRILLVTHQVNITGLTGVSPASGEIVVLRRDGERLAVAGRIPTA